MRHPDIAEICRRDKRYAYEAYEFIFEALGHTQKMVGKAPATGQEPGQENHVSGPEIVRGAVDLARQEFGLLAKTVFHQWGLRRTDDLGEIVFNLIEANLLSKTETDSRADFRDVFDLDRALTEGYTISLQPTDAPARRGVR
ncbi:MAG TPA: Minf_1886 family protein [Gemmataceae bacterium]|jgi:uncharacterized repeat protein (TIGR04138 family)|nr:Minf_1886 family protein [Gemmataceae bacterium]